MPSEELFYNQSNLLERGWSKKLVNDLLGEPDDFSVNPHYRTGPPVRRYLSSRVMAAESSPQFQKHLEDREKRSAKAIAAT